MTGAMDLHRLLGWPRFYSAFAGLVGGSARDIYARDYIRASSGDRILDIGCGPGDILAHLPTDVRYVGFDANPSYIENARQRFGGRGEFFCHHITRAMLDQFAGFDIVLANGVLHHLDDVDAMALLEIAQRALKTGGRLVTLDGCYVEGQSRVARYLLARDRGEFVRTQDEYARLTRPFFANVTLHIRDDLMRIPYTHIVMECRL